MGSKGNRIKGDFSRNYDGFVTWVNAKSFIRKIKDINYVEDQCGMKFPSKIRRKLRDEINSYITSNEIQKTAPHKGGSGRVRDFLADHIRKLTIIFSHSDGDLRFKRAKKIDGPGEEFNSQFCHFLRAINELYPDYLKCQGDGFIISGRKFLYKR